jgi:hypothetical protein
MATAATLRQSLVLLSSEATADLGALWAQIVGAADASDALMDTLPALVDDYGDAATMLAAQWYDDYRSELDIPGNYAADLADLDLGGNALAGWGSSLLTPEDVDGDAALKRISGGLE